MVSAHGLFQEWQNSGPPWRICLGGKCQHRIVMRSNLAVRWPTNTRTRYTSDYITRFVAAQRGPCGWIRLHRRSMSSCRILSPNSIGARLLCWIRSTSKRDVQPISNLQRLQRFNSRVAISHLCTSKVPVTSKDKACWGSEGKMKFPGLVFLVPIQLVSITGSPKIGSAKCLQPWIACFWEYEWTCLHFDQLQCEQQS